MALSLTTARTFSRGLRCALFCPKAYGYYGDINKLFDFYIDLVPSDTRVKAEKLLPAKRSTLPKFLFKEEAMFKREKVATSG